MYIVVAEKETTDRPVGKVSRRRRGLEWPHDFCAKSCLPFIFAYFITRDDAGDRSLIRGPDSECTRPSISNVMMK